MPDHTTEDLPPSLASALRYGAFHDALRLAIAHRGLSLSRLRAHLVQRNVEVGQSTLSYWQRGHRRPEIPQALPTVRALESVLLLPADSLVTLLGPRQPRNGHLAMKASYSELRPDTTGPVVDDLLAELGTHTASTRYNADVTLLAVHTEITLDDRGAMTTVASRTVVRSRADRPDRYTIVYTGDPGQRTSPAQLHAGDGCRVGRIRRHGEDTLAAELFFDRRLADDEVHVFSYTVRDTSETPSPGYFRMLRDPVSSYLLQIRFSPTHLPARCVREFRAHENSTPTDREHLVCGLGSVASAYFQAAGPGIAGIALEWN
ncbi:hypothetical protein EV193_103184 [Herbihabitans rhizosphaerae]|uniref:Uncharacterized protein n=1 Tax=Herbihabitans rhizosphaerae TaxID=1872711 RepID=A0A4Q7KX53_9PSEU|nr:hypothetical protein [Herbihabitans rhizosphaerae]RZS40870.1 hypothetical protein EV193_103184 [Herbihabitans rhizosphaerae]